MTKDLKDEAQGVKNPHAGCGSGALHAGHWLRAAYDQVLVDKDVFCSWVQTCCRAVAP